jgi:hypothetical protein
MGVPELGTVDHLLKFFNPVAVDVTRFNFPGRGASRKPRASASSVVELKTNRGLCGIVDVIEESSMGSDVDSGMEIICRTYVPLLEVRNNQWIKDYEERVIKILSRISVSGIFLVSVVCSL